jgi:hypothetical protein
MEKISVKTQLTFKDYRSLLFSLTYKKPIVILAVIIGFLMLTTSLLYFFGAFNSFSSPPYFQLVLGIFIVFYLPLSIHFQAKRNLIANKRLSEVITYEFTDDQINIIGESFSSSYDWQKINKFQITKKWVLIFQSKVIANIIKRDCFNESEFNTLLQIINSKKDLKKRIKK